MENSSQNGNNKIKTDQDVWQIVCLGGLRAVRGEQCVERFRTQKTAAMLALMALRGPHPREVLIDLLWPDLEIDAGRNNLSTSLSSLRRQLEADLPANSVLIADRASVGLNPRAFDTDVRRFEAALARAESASGDTERAQHLAEALTLYKGPFLPGFYEDWAQAEARRLEERFNLALARLLPLLESSGQIARAIEFARRGVFFHPTSETWHLSLMRLLAESGQFEAALRQFKDLQKALRRAGEEPSEAAHQLLKQIRRQARRLDAASVEVASSASDNIEQPAPALLQSGVVSLLMMDNPSSTTERETIESIIHEHGGTSMRRADDTLLWGFGRASQAVEAAASIEALVCGFAGSRLPRIAVNTGEVENRSGQFEGEVLERTVQLMLAAHPGQVLCGEATSSFLQAQGTQSASLRDLGRYRLGEGHAERLFQIVSASIESAERASFPPVRAVPARTGSLPQVFTRFFGRRAEIEALQALLESERLVTLTGVGGAGKTRLVTETARQLFDCLGGAVWFVPLAEIHDPSLILLAVRDAMRLPAAPGVAPRDQVTAALAAQPSLLILDNFEQLAEHGALCVAELLEAVPDLRILITSRQKLNLPAEREMPLSPLPVPDEEASLADLKEFSSTALFIDRARTVRADFALSERNARATSALCRRLDGIPLALELAAARSLVMSPAQILGKLEGQLDFLETRQKGVPERHRTLRGAIEWSFELLSPDLQRFFARLSAFHGGWTVEAAEAVCDEPEALESLTRLRECSLVEAQESAETVRFKMLETLREYSASRVEPEEYSELVARHFNYFLSLAEDTSEEVARGQSIERLELEQDNLRAALDWSLSDEADAARAQAGARLVIALRPLWNLRSRYAEAVAWSEKVLKRNDVAALLRARVLSGLGDFGWHLGDFEMALAGLEEGLKLFRDLQNPSGVADTLRSMGRVLVVSGGEERARACFEESLSLSRALGDRRSILLSLVNLCWVILNTPSPLSQLSTLEEALALAREMEDESSVATVVTVLGLIFYSQQRMAEAEKHFREGHDLCAQLGQQWERIATLWGLGSVARERGDFVRARSLLSEALQLCLTVGARWELSIQLNAVGFLTLREGRAEHAASLLGASERLRESTGHYLLGSQAAEHERYVSELRTSLEPQSLETAWSSGRLMSMERVVALALRDA
jgi:predicted ATPase/DNA-binding SARP family transcriptional activator